MLCCIVLCCIVLYCVVLCCIVFYCVVVLCAEMCCAVLFCLVGDFVLQVIYKYTTQKFTTMLPNLDMGEAFSLNKIFC